MPRFVPRQRKHKVLARQRNAQQTQDAKDPDSNAAVILPVDKADRNERKRKLKEELRAQQGPISGKKQKRLDKYIENKLKKDENLDYLRRLELEKQRTDAARAKLQTISGVNLGRKRTFEEFVNGTPHTQPSESADGAGSEAESEDSFEADHRDAFEVQDMVPVIDSVQQGSGLAKPSEIGDDGLPIIRTRQKRKKGKRKSQLQPFLHGEDEYSEWAGFSDDDNDGVSAAISDEVISSVEKVGSTIAEDKDEDEELSGSSSSDFADGSNDKHQGTHPSDSGDTEDTSGDDSALSEVANDNGKFRASAFKAWATQQLNKSLGHTPSYENNSLQQPLPSAKVAEKSTAAKPSEPGTQPPPIPSNPPRKIYAVHINRAEEIQQARSELPIIQREQEIMEAIHNNAVVIVKGDTGSGKTTQVPQFLYEAGYGSEGGPAPGMIGITQPRRVAAVSMAKRVGDELGDHSDKVSYQIRFDSSVSSKTALKFMTDGILIRELSQDLLLRKYSVIIIDEAHERSVNTDILIGMLSKIVPARMRKNQFNPNPTPLKLVIMSATLNIGDFINDRIFPPGQKPPIVEAQGRQHRVTTHFALRSRADYIEETIEKVRRAHRKLPRGGILVFLTGQGEIRQVAERLQELLVGRRFEKGSLSGFRVHAAASEIPLEVEDMEFEAVKYKEDQEDFDEIDIQTLSDDEVDDEEFNVTDEGDDKKTPARTSFNASKVLYNSVHIIPLYSQLPTRQQLRVFEPPPSGSRLIVLATNVAETSVTIPGIRYVFDTGRSKERKYNLDSGVQSFEIDYISKASAAQRAGRAGRTCPGHCWRLYSSAAYEQFFPEHAQPEILRAPAESVILQLKSFAYPKPVAEFPFPSAPDAGPLQKAEKLLMNLGALTTSGSITDLGKELSVYPLSPRLGKIVSRGISEIALLQHIVALVAGLAVSEVFVNESQLELVSDKTNDLADEQSDNQKQAYGRARATLSRQDKMSDGMKLLTAVTMYNTSADKEQFCKEYFLRTKAMLEVSQLQQQLTSIIKANNPTTHQGFTQQSKLSSKHIKQLNVIIASGYIDQVAIRADLSPNPPEIPSKPRRAIEVAYLPLIPLSDHPSASLHEKAIFIHPSSVLARHAPKDLPAYIIYTHLQKSQAHHISSTTTATKTRMFPLCPIDRAQLLELARNTALLNVGKPLPNSKIEDVKGTPRRRECWVACELKGRAGFGWPMPPARVRQVIDVQARSGWRVEEWLS